MGVKTRFLVLPIIPLLSWLAACQSDGTATVAHRQTQRSPQAIARVMEHEKKVLERIYGVELIDKPHLAGKLLLGLSIAASGRVSHCAVKATLMRDANFVSRVEERCRHLRFGPADRDMDIEYSMDFVSSGEPLPMPYP